MKTKLVSLLFALLLTNTAQGADLVHSWSQGYGGVSSDNLRAVAVDHLGNTYITGNFAGSVDFGGGPLTNAGIYDVFLAKFDINGNHLWSRSFGSTSSDYGYSIAVDASGNVFLAGRFGADINFGGATLINAGSSDIFIAKFDASGNHLWSRGLAPSASTTAMESPSIPPAMWPWADDFAEQSILAADR